MRFSALHEATSYLMVAAAFAPLALSRELPSLGVVLTLLAGVASFFYEPSRHPTMRQRGWSIAWNVASVAAFAWTVLESLRGRLLTAGALFLCFLLINKLWNRHSSRDYLHVYAISFLMLVAGAVLNNDLTYAACFFAYVVFATWTLTLFHLRREMEENYLIKHSDGGAERVEVDRILNSRRIVGWPFLGATALVSLAIFLGAALVFLLLPRLGLGLFASSSRPTLTVGFSDRVDLDRYGLVKDNPQVVMRVELPAGPPQEPLYFRGVTFDHYANGRWSRTLRRTARLHERGGLEFIGDERPSPQRARRLIDQALEQRIYLDPLDTGVLFGAARAIAFAVPATTVPIELEARAGDEIHALERQRGRLVERRSGLRYTVYSHIDRPDVPPRAYVDEDLTDEDQAPYLALPDDLPPRIAALAHTITRGHQGSWPKVVAIRDYLKRYRYTLELKRDRRYEPLEDFLFIEHAGHCEYFATALAILLRTVGVPTRSVNGFYGGRWNAYGRYLAVRQGDAHSWVEVYLDRVGWVTVDPTPPSAAVGPAASDSWTTLGQLIDDLQLAWFKYVIAYDLGQQVKLAHGLGEIAQQSTAGARLRQLWRRGARPLLLALPLALALWLLVSRRLRRGRRLPARDAGALNAYTRALRALERRGLVRRPGETGRELAQRLEQAGDPAAAPFRTLVEQYYAARFGGRAISPRELEQLARAVLEAPPSLDANAPSVARRF